MTFRMALKFIRRNAPETEQTFRAICRNRYCRPVPTCPRLGDLRSREVEKTAVRQRQTPL